MALIYVNSGSRVCGKSKDQNVNKGKMIEVNLLGK